MKRLNVALTAAALMSTGLLGTSEARASSSRTLSDHEVIRLSFSALQAKAADYGIGDSQKEFRVRQVVRDNLQQVHVRMDEVYKGIPVSGEQLITHFDARGRLLSVNGSYTPVDGLSLKPTLSGVQALELAMADFAQGVSVKPVVRLIIHVDELGDARLAYQIRLVDIDSAAPAAWMYFIDAHTGRILDDWDDLHTEASTGLGHSLYSGDVSFTTDSGAVGFTMSDPTRGGIQATDMMNGTSGNGLPFTDDDNEWGDGTNRDRATAGVDAYTGVQFTWDFYKDSLGRNGIRDDGKGSLARVHYSVNYVNAFWDDSCFCMTYGDGDGVNASPLVSIDVAGHEMTHGVTSATAGLNYSGQSGGLNESYSDIMGTMVEFYAESHGASTKGEYWIGEDVWTPTKPGDALRYMDDPTKDGRSIDNANRYRRGLDVHYSSGVSNNVFYLTSEGGRNKTSGKTVTNPIGHDKAAQIFYRALVTYMTPRTDWSGARSATIKAAGDLYGTGSQEVTTVTDAWNACGVTK